MLPAGARSPIAAIDSPAGPVEAAAPPLSVTVALADDLDVGRGDLIAGADDAAAVARHLEATVCWMAEAPLRAGHPLPAQAHDPPVRATIERLDTKVDMHTLDDIRPPAELELNDIGRVRLRRARRCSPTPTRATARPARSSSSTRLQRHGRRRA